MGTADSKPMYIKPGDIKAQAVFMDDQPLEQQFDGGQQQSDSEFDGGQQQSDSEFDGGQQQQSDSEFDGGQQQQSDSEFDGGQQQQSDSGQQQQSDSGPTPYPTTPGIKYTGLETSLSSALRTGMSQQYGTNAGSIQRQLGKTPGSMQGGAKVPLPEPVITTNMENISFLGVQSRFNTPLHVFDYKTNFKKINTSARDETYVGSG